MKYIMLIYTSEADQTEDPAVFGEYGKFTAEVQGNGMFQGGDPLHPTSSATTVRVRNGETLATDGPFAETKEQLGGYYILDCKDLDEAITYAAKIPGARFGSVEIRPILEM